MLLQLSIDVPETLTDAAQVRAEALSRFSGVLSDLCQSGALGDIRTMDLSKVTTDDEDTAHKDYADGYNAGFTNGYRLAAIGHTETPAAPVPLPSPSEPAPTPAPARVDWSAWHNQNTRPAGISVPLASGALPQRIRPADIGDPVNLGPLMFDDPARPGHQITFGDALRRAADHQATVLAMQPRGPRPAPGPGAPPSAFDQMSTRLAYDSHGFPGDPDHGQPWIDKEGAEWRYHAGEYAWIRQTYPRVWGTTDASTLDVDVPVDSYSPENLDNYRAANNMLRNVNGTGELRL